LRGPSPQKEGGVQNNTDKKNEITKVIQPVIIKHRTVKKYKCAMREIFKIICTPLEYAVAM
jgi:hypothetical protein